MSQDTHPSSGHLHVLNALEAWQSLESDTAKYRDSEHFMSLYSSIAVLLESACNGKSVQDGQVLSTDDAVMELFLALTKVPQGVARSSSIAPEIARADCVSPPPIVPFVVTMTLSEVAEQLKIYETMKAVYTPRQDVLAELRQQTDWTITVIEERKKRRDILAADAKARVKRLQDYRAELNTRLQEIAHPIQKLQAAITGLTKYVVLIGQLREFERIPEVVNLPDLEVFVVPTPPEALEVKRPPVSEEIEEEEELEEMALP